MLSVHDDDAWDATEHGIYNQFSNAGHWNGKLYFKNMVVHSEI